MVFDTEQRELNEMHKNLVISGDTVYLKKHTRNET